MYIQLNDSYPFFLAFRLPRLNLLELIKDEFYEENVALTYSPMDKRLSCTISGLNIFAIEDVDIENNKDLWKCLIALLDYGNYQDLMGIYVFDLPKNTSVSVNNTNRTTS